MDILVGEGLKSWKTFLGRKLRKLSMAEPRIEPVPCPECEMQAEVRERPSGSFEEVVTDILPKCKREPEQGSAVLKCRSLRRAFFEAHQRLRRLSRKIPPDAASGEHHGCPASLICFFMPRVVN